MSSRTVRVCKKMLMLGALAQIGILKAHEATTITSNTAAITDNDDSFLEKIIDSQYVSQKYLHKLAEIVQLLNNNEIISSQQLFSKQSQQHPTESSSSSQEHQKHEEHNSNKDKKKNKNDEDNSENHGSGEESDSESDSDSDDEDDRNGGITIPVLEWVKGIFPRIIPHPQTNN